MGKQGSGKTTFRKQLQAKTLGECQIVEENVTDQLIRSLLVKDEKSTVFLESQNHTYETVPMDIVLHRDFSFYQTIGVDEKGVAILYEDIL